MSENTVTLQKNVIAIDDGYAQTKSARRVDSKIVCQKFVTHICNGQTFANLTDAEDEVSRTYQVGDEFFTVGGTDAGEHTRFDSFHISPLNRVAVHHAMFSQGMDTQEVDIIVGLPVRDYFNADGTKNIDLIEKKKQNLLSPCGRVGVKGNDHIHVRDVKIVSQAVASYIDAAFDEQGNSRLGRDEPTAIVDIGGRTTDIALVLDGSKVDMRVSATHNIGVLDVHSELEKLIHAKFPMIRGAIVPGKLDEAVRTGKMRLFGSVQDLSGEVANAKAAVAGRLERAIQKVLGSAYNVDHVLLVGGGAVVFSEIASLWQQSRVLDEPEFSNVRGMLKLAELV